MQPGQPCRQPSAMPDKVPFPGGCCVSALSLTEGVGGALFNISIRSCPINSGSLSRLKGTAAQAWTRCEAAPDTKRDAGTSSLVCRSCLLSAWHLASPPASPPCPLCTPRPGRQTDGVTIGQRGPREWYKGTRHAKNAAQIVQELTRRRARGRPGHQYGAADSDCHHADTHSANYQC